MTGKRLLTILVFAIGSLLTILLFTSLSKEERTLVNFFTVYGTFASLFGLWVAYVQIQTVKKETQQTQVAVVESLLRINQILSVSDLARAIKTIHEIQHYLLYKKHELALLRMKDLKGTLIQVKYNQDLSNLTHSQEYSRAVTDLGIDMVNINNLISGGKTGVNLMRVSENLEKTETLLSDFENKLKFGRHDS